MFASSRPQLCYSGFGSFHTTYGPAIDEDIYSLLELDPYPVANGLLRCMVPLRQVLNVFRFLYTTDFDSRRDAIDHRAPNAKWNEKSAKVPRP